jgi:hypothetical protein
MLVPVHGAATYKANGFGFLGAGRGFWGPSQARVTYYLGTPAGWWILASCVLLLGTIEGLIRRRARDRELVATCGVMHAGFVGLFFGNAWSWGHYAYLLSLGVSALAARSRWHAGVVALVALVALTGRKAEVVESRRLWTETGRAASTAGLWVAPEEESEWRAVVGRAPARGTTILATSDGVMSLYPRFGRPALFYLAEGQVTPREMGRKLGQIGSARAVIEAVGVLGTWPSEGWPEFEEALGAYRVVHRGKYYRLYVKGQAAGPP